MEKKGKKESRVTIRRGYSSIGFDGEPSENNAGSILHKIPKRVLYISQFFPSSILISLDCIMTVEISVLKMIKQTNVIQNQKRQNIPSALEIIFGKVSCTAP